MIMVAIGLALRLFAGQLDRQRIREQIEGRGGKLLDISWNPWGKGWLGSANERIYEVQYRRPDGKIIAATCKTSMWSGVYWTSDAAPSDFLESPFPGTTSESMQCLACGAAIPASQSRCAKCGWSYTDS